MEVQYISLNMTPTGVNPCFHISQYDIGRSLGFIVYNGSEVVDLDSYTCTIEATRSDGVAITASVTTNDNIGTFETTATMTNKADKYRAQFVIVDGDSNRIASLPFDMDVCKAAMDENAESIEEDASLYQQYTEAVQGAIAEANADIQAEENARIAAINAEAITRANADTTLQNNIDAEATARANAITAEATARQTADNTLQGNIDSEASTRASADSNLQSQIDQIIAPSGEAPSAAEVLNARIGADGVTYDTLGNAIRGQVTDLKSALNYVGENRANYTIDYGNVTTQSVGVILRSLNVLENQGLGNFFGEPELDLHDFVAVDNNGKGIINILDAVELYKYPDLYASVMLWMLTELYNKMPEVGDLDKPKIVFFFDEAYFLFREMPPYRLKQVEKIVRLIRSKGIGLYFISHYSVDIPDTILEQLGNRVQHNLRAYTPADQKIVKAAADSFRTNPSFKTYDTILELGTGEAIISFQNEKGEPEVVEKATILPPQSKMGTIDEISRNKIINSSTLLGKYDEAVERDSAYEELDKMIKEQYEAEAAEKQAIQEAKDAEKAAKEAEKAQKQAEKEKKEKKKYIKIMV